MTSCGAGTCTVRKTRPSGLSTMPLLPVRKRSARNSRNGSLATSAALTRRSLPLATSVTTIAARRAARSVFKVLRRSSFIVSSRLCLVDLLHIDADGTAAGQPDFPGGLVGNAEFQHFRFAAVDHVECFGHHRAFDAAARHRAQKIAFTVDDQIGADRTRRRAPGLYDSRQRNVAAVLAPVLGGFENVVVGREHFAFSASSALSWPAKAGHPVTTDQSAFTGSSAFADDDSKHDQYSASRHLLHPSLGVTGAAAAVLQCGDQAGHRFEIVDRAEFVDVGQHGADAAGARLETLEAKQRIEPDQ